MQAATQRSGDGAADRARSWHHLALVAKSGQITLYVDGNPFATLAAALPTMTGASQLGRGGAAPAAARPQRISAASATPAAAPASTLRHAGSAVQ